MEARPPGFTVGRVAVPTREVNLMRKIGLLVLVLALVLSLAAIGAGWKWGSGGGTPAAGWTWDENSASYVWSDI
jgi:hypothetical protein